MACSSGTEYTVGFRLLIFYVGLLDTHPNNSLIMYMFLRLLGMLDTAVEIWSQHE